MKHQEHSVDKPEFEEIIKLETCFAAEQEHIWKNMIKLERIRKENLARKKILMHKNIRAD